MINSKKQIEVSAAVILHNGCLLATQRGYGEWKDWWEFPGGKLEAGETPAVCLRREIKEELDVEIEVFAELTCIHYEYPAFHLILHCFGCRLLSEELTLVEHEAACWLSASNLRSVRWLPADEAALPSIEHWLETTLPNSSLLAAGGIGTGDAELAALALGEEGVK